VYAECDPGSVAAARGHGAQAVHARTRVQPAPLPRAHARRHPAHRRPLSFPGRDRCVLARRHLQGMGPPRLPPFSRACVCICVRPGELRDGCAHRVSQDARVGTSLPVRQVQASVCAARRRGTILCNPQAWPLPVRYGATVPVDPVRPHSGRHWYARTHVRPPLPLPDQHPPCTLPMLLAQVWGL
jgi:hypothetical protein